MALSAPSGRVIVLATLDTKAEEVRLVAHEISKHGCTPWVVDLGIAGTASFSGDTPRETVAAAGDAVLGSQSQAEKAANMSAMQLGAVQIVNDMLARGEIAGVIGIGGGQGSWLASGVMRQLPIGFPKVLISTAGPAPGQYVGSTDIMAVFSITDMAGLNRVVRPILINAAAAVCGMAQDPPSVLDSGVPTVALTMYGITSEGAVLVKRALERGGYEVLTFHANGVGGRTMEELIDRRLCSAVLDWSITELADELVGGICSAGPDRLHAAGAEGLPQVVVPGGIDVVNFAERDTVPPQFSDRRFYMHTPNATLMRTSIEENERLGNIVAAKLNVARGPVTVLIPQQGYSVLSGPGAPFFDAAADQAFSSALKERLSAAVEVIELPCNINDPTFGAAAAEAMLANLAQLAGQDVVRAPTNTSDV